MQTKLRREKVKRDKMIPFSMKMPATLFIDLENASKKHDIAMSDIIRFALRKYLNELNNEELQKLILISQKG